ERFTILLSLIKLKLLVGKSIIFVSSTDRCYKLSLFLQAFKIRSCVLNSQMPANYRCHVIQEFNEGKYPCIIASDTNDAIGTDDAAQDEEQAQASSSKKEKKKKGKEQKPTKDTRKGKNLDKESGVSRGIDFHFVSNVVNFDFPTSTDTYIHRVGRTARGWNKGTAISFASPKERTLFEVVQEEINEQMGQEVLTPYEIRMKDFESFQLRAREALAACTKTVIREARLAEIRQELLKSKRLEAYFTQNPREKAALEQDKKLFRLNLHSAAIADVPDYIVPKALRGQQYGNDDAKKPQRHRKRKSQGGQAQSKHKKKMADPLQSFKF
ncbi:DEAD box protein/DEAH protein box helicase, partial [Aphelenchoides avenae]